MFTEAIYGYYISIHIGCKSKTSGRFCVLHTRRRRRLAETLREPLAVTVRDGPRRVTEIASLIDEGIIRPVVDRVFPFASTKEAMAYVEAGRAKGKVVVSLK